MDNEMMKKNENNNGKWMKNENEEVIVIMKMK